MQRNISLDVLKLVMALMIIALHAGFLSQVSGLGSYLTVQGVFRIVVPVFLLISGFFFFSVLTNPKASPAAWFKRIIILYGVWMAAYAVFWCQLPDDSLHSWLALLKTVVFGYYHLWYLSGMVMAAGLLYVLRNLSSKSLWGCTIVTFLLGVIIQYAANYYWLPGATINNVLQFNPLHRGPLLLSFPFFTMGYLLHKQGWHERISLKQASVCAVIGLGCLLAESYANFLMTQGSKGFDNFLSLIVVCPAVFLMFMKMNMTGQSKNVALYSSAVYFVHLMFLNLLREYTHLEGVLLMLATIPLALMASFVVIRLHQRNVLGFQYIL